MEKVKMTADGGLAPLAITALALLSERPMHPYEMYQLILERREDRLIKVSAGTLYRTVVRLTDAGLAVATGTAREGNRPERTTYAITEPGREQLHTHIRALLRDPASEFPPFVLGLAESHNATRDEVVEDLRTHLSHLDAEIDEVVRIIHSAEDRGVPEAYWLTATYIRHMREAQHDWVSRFISRLDKDDIAWP